MWRRTMHPVSGKTAERKEKHKEAWTSLAPPSLSFLTLMTVWMSLTLQCTPPPPDDGSSPAGSTSSRPEDEVVDPGPGELGWEDEPSHSDLDSESDGASMFDVEPVLDHGDGVWVDPCFGANRTPSPHMNSFSGGIRLSRFQLNQLTSSLLPFMTQSSSLSSTLSSSRFSFQFWSRRISSSLFCATPHLDPPAEDGGQDMAEEEDVISEGSSQESPGPTSFPCDFVRRRRRREESEQKDRGGGGCCQEAEVQQ
ncbi:uncharacterized protein V6R79_004660 [Siganus canaliculatus]